MRTFPDSIVRSPYAHEFSSLEGESVRSPQIIHSKVLGELFPEKRA